MTKEQKIKEEWDKLSPTSQLTINPDTGFTIIYCINGISDLTENTIISADDIEWEYKDDDFIKFRPKSLKGIENNNGWIKIESEKDLPTDDTMYRSGFFKKDGEFYQDNNLFNLKTTLQALTQNHYTHYQLINKPESPLY